MKVGQWSEAGHGRGGGACRLRRAGRPARDDGMSPASAARSYGRHDGQGGAAARRESR